MIRLRHKLIIDLLRLFDIALLVAVGYSFGAFSFPPETADSKVAMDQLTRHWTDGLAWAGLMASWVVTLNSLVRYEANQFVDLGAQIINILKGTFCATAWLALAALVCKTVRISPPTLLLFWSVTSFMGILSRLLTQLALKLVRRSHLTNRHLLILGDLQHAVSLAERLEAKPELGYKIEGLLRTPEDVGNPIPTANRWPILGESSSLKTILQKGVVDEVIITTARNTDLAATLMSIQIGQQKGVVVRLVPDKSHVDLLAEAQLEMFEEQYVITFFREVLIWHLFAKRLLDVAVSFTLLILLSPIFLVVAILIRAESPGPVFFAQDRVGMNRRQFRMYKFRSMYKDAEKRRKEFEHLNEMDGPVFKILNDPRITPLGRVIRTWSIDELPQLWNVFRGEMSLVGPRPPIPSEVSNYEWLNHHRLSIRPGITCLWQISGRSELSFQQWMDLDRQYIENWSFWLDLIILFKTIPAVILRRGAA